MKPVFGLRFYVLFGLGYTIGLEISSNLSRYIRQRKLTKEIGKPANDIYFKALTDDVLDGRIISKEELELA